MDAPKPRYKPGPHSRDHVLSTIDRRTRAGRVLRTTEAELIEHVGGHPTAAERLLIQAASIKATRLALLSEKLLSGEDMSEGSDAHILAWLNSMRLDLAALGLERRAKDITPRLDDYLARKTGATA